MGEAAPGRAGSHPAGHFDTWRAAALKTERAGRTTPAWCVGAFERGCSVGGGIGEARGEGRGCNRAEARGSTVRCRVERRRDERTERSRRRRSCRRLFDAIPSLVLGLGVVVGAVRLLRLLVGLSRPQRPTVARITQRYFAAALERGWGGFGPKRHFLAAQSALVTGPVQSLFVGSSCAEIRSGQCRSTDEVGVQVAFRPFGVNTSVVECRVPSVECLLRVMLAPRPSFVLFVVRLCPGAAALRACSCIAERNLTGCCRALCAAACSFCNPLKESGQSQKGITQPRRWAQLVWGFLLVVSCLRRMQLEGLKRADLEVVW